MNAKKVLSDTNIFNYNTLFYYDAGAQHIWCGW